MEQSFERFKGQYLQETKPKIKKKKLRDPGIKNGGGIGCAGLGCRITLKKAGCI